MNTITYKELSFVAQFSFILGFLVFIFTILTPVIGMVIILIELATPFVVPIVFYHTYNRILSIELTRGKALIAFIVIYFIERLFFIGGLNLIDLSGDWKQSAIQMFVYAIISWIVWVIYKKIKTSI